MKTWFAPQDPHGHGYVRRGAAVPGEEDGERPWFISFRTALLGIRYEVHVETYTKKQLKME